MVITDVVVRDNDSHALVEVLMWDASDSNLLERPLHEVVILEGDLNSSERNNVVGNDTATEVPMQEANDLNLSERPFHEVVSLADNLNTSESNNVVSNDTATEVPMQGQIMGDVITNESVCHAAYNFSYCSFWFFIVPCLSKICFVLKLPAFWE